MAGLRVGQAYGGVPPTWVWVVGVSPQILEHPTSICDTGVKAFLTVPDQKHQNYVFCDIFLFLTEFTSSVFWQTVIFWQYW